MADEFRIEERPIISEPSVLIAGTSGKSDNICKISLHAEGQIPADYDALRQHGEETYPHEAAAFCLGRMDEQPLELAS
jgi:hypothetical protein